MSLNKAISIIASFNNTILSQNDLSNKTNNDSSPYVSEENKNEGYLFLLVFDLLIFCSLTYTTYTSAKRLEKEVESPEEFRLKFIKWLVLANGLRSLSLLFILIISNPNGNNGISWINSLLHVAPAFVFLSSYMYLATFFSDTYYFTIDYRNHLLKPALTILINVGYILLTIIALITLAARTFKAFFYISELLMALLYLVLGSVIVYFGHKVSEVFQSKSQADNFESNKKQQTFGFMSFSIGALFILKGVSGILVGVGLYEPGNQNIYDFFWFLILEVLPTVIFIYFSKIKISNNYNNDTPRSSVNELDLSSVRNTSYRPPFEKE